MENEDDPTFQSFSNQSEKTDLITVSLQSEEISKQSDLELNESNESEVIVSTQTISSPDSAPPTRIIIVGTAHVSEKSVREVQKTIEDEKPDIVAVELCPTRYKSITDPDAEKQISF
ncbi:MAG: TraB domain-containing protein, partial [Methanimicrococcus sp.]|nr:TraB domain-containing protein [Methanimicrococcus sp.]